MIKLLCLSTVWAKNAAAGGIVPAIVSECEIDSAPRHNPLTLIVILLLQR
jgi:hypothetical protein